MTLDTDFKDFIELLNKHSVQYLVVGGYAMAAHGRPRYTGDLDIWIEISDGNATKMVTVIDEFGFSSLGFVKADFLQENIVGQIGYPPLRIDILTVIDGVGFEEAYQHKRTISVDNVEMAFIGLNQLIANKKASNRSQDLADLASLQVRANYSLAIMPSLPIHEDVRGFKQKLRDVIGKSYGSVNADGHISLDGFDAAEVDYPLILAEYKRLVSQLTPFQLNFSGFADFDRANFSAFYIKPTEDSCNAICERTQAIMKGFDKKFKKQYMQKWADESKNPHMSIGRRLTREWIALAYSIFTGYEAGFLCESFAIRKYNEKRRQYEVIDTIKLEGQNGVGEQISLF